jgi:signal peptidase
MIPAYNLRLLWLSLLKNYQKGTAAKGFNLTRIVMLIRILAYLTAGLIILAMLFLPQSVLPSLGHYKLLTVISDSMTPALHRGDLLVVSPKSGDDYQVGEIITFGKMGVNETSITHRIVGVSSQNGQWEYLTTGDANNERDLRPVSAQEVIGRVILVFPYGGKVLNWLRQPGRIKFFIFVVGWLFISKLSKFAKSGVN